jgi:uncharacterized membrane protein YeaQ/YmgE (transglycosylase-associated protein family)
MTIIAWLVLGAIAGYASDYILKRKSVNVFRTIAFGIAGALIGGVVGGFFAAIFSGGKYDFNTLLSGFDLVSIVTAIVGAVLVGFAARWWEAQP